MFDSHKWNIVEGKGNSECLTLLSLSTCGFCISARKYLDCRGLAYRYLDLDSIEPEAKAAIKAEFRNRFHRRPSFPSLVIDGERFLVGFAKVRWDKEVHPEGFSK